MGKRRFIAPAREEVMPEIFAQPIYADLQAELPWLVNRQWPDIETLNAQLHQDQALRGYRFATQDARLLSDGLHYETRIAQHGVIATRERNWHDLFNACIWRRYPAIKRALNARQIAEIACMGPHARNRAQYALTQFDEAGVIVRVRDAALLEKWDRHDWLGLFYEHAHAWRDGAITIAGVIGHALLEHGLLPDVFVIGKCVVLHGEADYMQSVAAVAEAIAEGELLQDPLELRPLPLAGIPGWHRHAGDERFYREAPCFSPLREGRQYPSPLKMQQSSTVESLDEVNLALTLLARG